MSTSSRQGSPVQVPTMGHLQCQQETPDWEQRTTPFRTEDTSTGHPLSAVRSQEEAYRQQRNELPQLLVLAGGVLVGTEEVAAQAQALKGGSAAQQLCAAQ